MRSTRVHRRRVRVRSRRLLPLSLLHERKSVGRVRGGTGTKRKRDTDEEESEFSKDQNTLATILKDYDEKSFNTFWEMYENIDMRSLLNSQFPDSESVTIEVVRKILNPLIIIFYSKRQHLAALLDKLFEFDKTIEGHTYFGLGDQHTFQNLQFLMTQRGLPTRTIEIFLDKLEILFDKTALKKTFLMLNRTALKDPMRHAAKFNPKNGSLCLD